MPPTKDGAKLEGEVHLLNPETGFGFSLAGVTGLIAYNLWHIFFKTLVGKNKEGAKRSTLRIEDFAPEKKK